MLLGPRAIVSMRCTAPHALIPGICRRAVLALIGSLCAFIVRRLKIAWLFHQPFLSGVLLSLHMSDPVRGALLTELAGPDASIIIRVALNAALASALFVAAAPWRASVVSQGLGI